MKKKCVLLLLDGLGDRSYSELSNQTPLQAAKTPYLDKLAKEGVNGLYHASFPGDALPSENAHFSIFGYDMKDFPGRGALEAIGAGISLCPSDIAILAHFACLRRKEKILILENGKPKAGAGEIEELVDSVSDININDINISFKRTHGLYGIIVLKGDVSPYITDTDPITSDMPLIEPQVLDSAKKDINAYKTCDALKTYLINIYSNLLNHPVNTFRQKKGAFPINGLVTQRAGRLKIVKCFYKKYGLKGVSLSSGLIYQGLASYIGMDFKIFNDCADPGLDICERIVHGQSILDKYDFIHIHTKAPDETAHSKDPFAKKKAIESLDRGISKALSPFIDDPEVYVIVTADHSTPSSGPLIHSGEPVPITICGHGVRVDNVNKFDEISAAAGALGFIRGRELMYLVLNYLDMIKLKGLMDMPCDQAFWHGHYKPFTL